MTRRVVFVTGRLAEQSLRRVLDQLPAPQGTVWEVVVLPISVAALMHADWVSRKLDLNDVETIERVILPGWCQGSLDSLQARFAAEFELGPKDLFDLPEILSGRRRQPAQLDAFSIEIIAEINHAPRMSRAELHELAERYRAAGADVIDLGCIPGENWSGVGDVTRELTDLGLRCSIDSFNRTEVETAVDAGAELVLSCNATNREWASQLGAELVVIPDRELHLDTLAETLDYLHEQGARCRIDPILEPIGFGFTDSLKRYFDARQRWPDTAMMMGVGNLTELTEVDSAGINLLLCALCEELRIGSVLTTEVINWCRTSVAEIDFARRLVHHSISQRVLPKHIDSSLARLRDPRVSELGAKELVLLAEQVRDPNFRIRMERDAVHVFNRDGLWSGRDPFELFERVTADSPVEDPGHAFYLGYEFAKATIARQLGKDYVQDQALNWGDLTEPEVSARDRHRQSRGY